jgi:chromosome segregation ATPase
MSMGPEERQELLRADLREARARVRAAAARFRAQREAAEAQLGRLEPELARVRAAVAAATGGAPDRAAEHQALLADTEARVTALRGEVALAARGEEEARTELASLERAERDLQMLPVRAALAAEPFATAPEDVALAHVRAGIADLEAAVALGDELAPASTAAAAPGTDPAAAGAAPAPAPALSPEEQARAELAALKARRRGPGDPGAR